MALRVAIFFGQPKGEKIFLPPYNKSFRVVHCAGQNSRIRERVFQKETDKIIAKKVFLINRDFFLTKIFPFNTLNNKEERWKRSIWKRERNFAILSPPKKYFLIYFSNFLLHCSRAMIATLARALLSRDFFLYIPPRYRNNTKVYFLSLSLSPLSFPFPSRRTVAQQCCRVTHDYSRYRRRITSIR